MDFLIRKMRFIGYSLSEKIDKNYLFEVKGQKGKDVKDCLTTLIRNDF